MSRNDQTHKDPGVDDLIDQNIRLFYDGLIQEGLPDRFRDLLAVIRAEDSLSSRADHTSDGSEE